MERQKAEKSTQFNFTVPVSDYRWIAAQAALKDWSNAQYLRKVVRAAREAEEAAREEAE